MPNNRNIAIFQVLLVVFCSLGVWQYSLQDNIENTNQSKIELIDSNGNLHFFEETPQRVAITNTYAASVMRMLEVNTSVVTGVSGDFYDADLWPEYVDTPMIQQSAHSEIDFEALLDSRPDVYIVFATNGMVDTNAIRDKLEPVGIKVLALDFYKYDSLRYEISVIAELFGKQSQAEDLFQEFDSIEAEVSSRISSLNESERPQVVMEHHASLTRDPVVLTGTSQWTDIIERAGGNNVFKNLPGHTTHVDMEAILDSNPDVIMFDGITFDIGFNAFDEENQCGNHMDFIKTRPGFEELSAIVNDRMIIMSGEFAGPMMIHGLPTLAKILHPELFEDLNAELIISDFFEKYHDIDMRGKFVCKSAGS
jgi:iron complex transport system substrate-binding protein|tara:strand:+ start:3996 stop:5093 length:1098 start_codon:yes stop_codon:yes gene_type:complete